MTKSSLLFIERDAVYGMLINPNCYPNSFNVVCGHVGYYTMASGVRTENGHVLNLFDHDGLSIDIHCPIFTV